MPSIDSMKLTVRVLEQDATYLVVQGPSSRTRIALEDVMNPDAIKQGELVDLQIRDGAMVEQTRQVRVDVSLQPLAEPAFGREGEVLGMAEVEAAGRQYAANLGFLPDEYFGTTTCPGPTGSHGPYNDDSGYFDDAK